MKDLSTLRVAIVHDWLIGGGAEQVVLELHRMFPEAPIYTSYATKTWQATLDGKVITGYLQYWPFSKLRKFLPVLRGWWFSHLDFTGYDLVISSSGNGEAKGVRVPSGTVHVCYCHTPTHYYWRHYDQYLKFPGFGAMDPLARLGLRLLVGPLRRRDYTYAQRPDYFIANSTHIQNDIKTYYGRDAVVIHPPVDVARFRAAATNPTRSGCVTMGRQAPYKRTNLIVAACNQLSLPLKVIGRGPDHQQLVAMAGAHTTFLVDVSDEAMPAQLASAEVFLFAAHEDFGIAPVEALAAGTPVIAYKAGGALDYIEPGKTGLFFDEQTEDSLAAALKTFSPSAFDRAAISRSSEQFSARAFQEKLKDFLTSLPDK
ncbi:MAG TPA: glycosyltransferase [Candidatus Saccharimonadales bacterium]|nr:glycosyltransferase [Candidatus Saccharimonadales bacterium]